MKKYEAKNPFEGNYSKKIEKYREKPMQQELTPVAYLGDSSRSVKSWDKPFSKKLTF